MCAVNTMSANRRICDQTKKPKIAQKRVATTYAMSLMTFSIASTTESIILVPPALRRLRLPAHGLSITSPARQPRRSCKAGVPLRDPPIRLARRSGWLRPGRREEPGWGMIPAGVEVFVGLEPIDLRWASTAWTGWWLRSDRLQPLRPGSWRFDRLAHSRPLRARPGRPGTGARPGRGDLLGTCSGTVRLLPLAPSQ